MRKIRTMLGNWQEYAPENRTTWTQTSSVTEGQTENGTTNKQLSEDGADGRKRFSRVWLLRADKLTMVETQSDQFLSHRTSAYIISLLSPPRPSAPAPLIYASHRSANQSVLFTQSKTAKGCSEFHQCFTTWKVHAGAAEENPNRAEDV